MLKNLLNACLIFCMIWLAPSAIAAGLAGYANSNVIARAQEDISKVQRVQQPKKSSRIGGMDHASAHHAMCHSSYMPLMGFPAYLACVW